MQDLLAALAEHPVIAAARDDAGIEEAVASDAAVVFLLGGSILTLRDMVSRVRAGGKYAFVHLDLLAGLGRDTQAVTWCVRESAPDGVISTRTPLLKYAADLGVHTIQRLFLVDSSSLKHGENTFKTYAPDMLEVLPGLVPKAIAQLRRALGRPIIAGGMITERADIQAALEAGATAVSTSETALWRVAGTPGKGRAL